jgi:hypothetical protein
MCVGFGSLTIRCAIILALICGSGPPWENGSEPPVAGASKYGLMATQLLDDIGAGVNGLTAITLTRAITHGTGRFNLVFGVVQTSWGLGAAMSNLVGGYMTAISYQVAFFFLGAVSIVPILTTIFGIKEPPKQLLELKADTSQDKCQEDMVRGA